MNPHWKLSFRGTKDPNRFEVWAQALDVHRKPISDKNYLFGFILRLNNGLMWKALAPQHLPPHLPQERWIGSFPTRQQAAEAILGERTKHLSGIVLRRSRIPSTAERERLIQQFTASGRTTHSARAETLPILVEYCEQYQIPYTLRALPGQGYELKRDV